MREFSLLDIMKYYLKYFWIAVIITCFAELIGVLYTETIFVPMYQESTTIILGKSNNTTEAEISSSTISLYDSLIDNYLQLLGSTKLLSNVKEDLNLKYSINELAKSINYSISGGSQMIEISVVNEDDELAVDICNQIVIELKQQVYDIYGIDNISVVDEPKASGEKIYSEGIIVVIFTILGFVLSSIMIILKFIFSEKIVESKHATKLLDIDVLGKVTHYNNKKIKLPLELTPYEKDDFRNIRAELLTNLNKTTKTIMLTSLYQNQSKSYITYHLASTLEKINKKILIIDANVKDGFLMKEFMSQEKGLLEALNTEKKSIKINNTYNNIAMSTIGDNNIDMLSSQDFFNVLEKLKTQYDYIFIESPPFQNNFVSTAILSLIDEVILIVEPNQNKLDDLLSVKEKVKKADKTILGIIFEKTSYSQKLKPSKIINNKKSKKVMKRKASFIKNKLTNFSNALKDITKKQPKKTEKRNNKPELATVSEKKKTSTKVKSENKKVKKDIKEEPKAKEKRRKVNTKLEATSSITDEPKKQLSKNKIKKR